nr:unnamed protein product [Naegleria fowleri]
MQHPPLSSISSNITSIANPTDHNNNNSTLSTASQQDFQQHLSIPHSQHVEISQQSSPIPMDTVPNTQQQTPARNTMHLQIPPSPLFEWLAPFVEPLFHRLNTMLDILYEKYGLIKVDPLLNVFSLCLIACFCLLIGDVSHVPVGILCVGFLGISCGWMAMWCQDPLLMVLYAGLNAVGLMFCLSKLSWGYADVSFSFGILWIAQFRSCSLAMHYYRMRIHRKEQSMMQELSETVHV